MEEVFGQQWATFKDCIPRYTDNIRIDNPKVILLAFVDFHP